MTMRVPVPPPPTYQPHSDLEPTSVPTSRRTLWVVLGVTAAIVVAIVVFG